MGEASPLSPLRWPSHTRRPPRRPCQVRSCALHRPLPNTAADTQANGPTAQTTLGPPDGHQRARGAEVAATYHPRRELCQQAGDTAELFPVLYGCCCCMWDAPSLRRRGSSWNSASAWPASRADAPPDGPHRPGNKYDYRGQLTQAHVSTSKAYASTTATAPSLAIATGIDLAKGAWRKLGGPVAPGLRSRTGAGERGTDAGQHLEHPYTWRGGSTDASHQWRRERQGSTSTPQRPHRVPPSR